MTFPEYVIGLQPYIHPESRRQTTRNILEHCCEPKETKDATTYQKYSDPKTPYQISSYAKKIISRFNIEIYKNYLKGLNWNYDTQKAIQTIFMKSYNEHFKEDNDILKVDNVEDGLAKLLKKILKEAVEHENSHKHTKSNKTASDISSLEKPTPSIIDNSIQLERKIEFSYLYYCSSLVQYENYENKYKYWDDIVVDFISKQRQPCIDLSDPNNVSTTLCEGKLYKLTTECSFTIEEKFDDTLAIVQFKYKDRFYKDYTSYNNWITTSKLNLFLLFNQAKVTLLFDVKNADIGQIRIFIIGDRYDDYN